MMSSSGEISCTGVDLHYDYHGSTTHLFFSLSPYLYLRWAEFLLILFCKPPQLRARPRTAGTRQIARP